jgi:hypothetical protein
MNYVMTSDKNYLVLLRMLRAFVGHYHDSGMLEKVRVLPIAGFRQKGMGEIKAWVGRI